MLTWKWVIDKCLYEFNIATHWRMCIVLCCCCRAIADEYYPNDAFTSDAPPIFYTLLHCIYMLMSTLFIYGQSHSSFVALHSAHLSAYVCISGRVIKTYTNGRVRANVCVRLLPRKNCRMGRNGGSLTFAIHHNVKSITATMIA